MRKKVRKRTEHIMELSIVKSDDVLFGDDLPDNIVLKACDGSHIIVGEHREYAQDEVLALVKNAIETGARLQDEYMKGISMPGTVKTVKQWVKR